MPTKNDISMGQLFVENISGEYIPLAKGGIPDFSPLWIENDNEKEYVIPDIIAQNFTFSAKCIPSKVFKYVIFGCSKKRLLRQAIRRAEIIRKAAKKKGLHFSTAFITNVACAFVLENARKYRHRG